MKNNHIPAAKRLKNRIYNLERQLDEVHIPSPTKGNPYWCCKVCGIYDPELSVRDGKHYSGCQAGGLPKQIKYYKKLLNDLK